VRQVTWDGLDFAALQMFLHDRRHDGAPTCRWPSKGVAELMILPDFWAPLLPGHAIQLHDDGAVKIVLSLEGT